LSLGDLAGGCTRFAPPPLAVGCGGGGQIWGIGGVLTDCRRRIYTSGDHDGHAGSFGRPTGQQCSGLRRRWLVLGEWLWCATGLQQGEAGSSSWRCGGPSRWGCDTCCGPAAGSSYEGRQLAASSSSMAVGVEAWQAASGRFLVSTVNNGWRRGKLSRRALAACSSLVIG
jgi:hypothetical protein